MHPYSTDSEERTNVPLFLVIVSIAAAWSLRDLLSDMELHLPWWLDAPSVMGFYAGLHLLFDRVLWRMPLLRRMGICCIPDLSGTWRGTLRSSLNSFRYEREITAEVQQSWTRISIRLHTKSSASRSLLASILTAGDLGTVVSYQYLNEPKADRPVDTKYAMHAHRGTAWLNLSETGDVLEGEYHTGKDRKNFGTLSLTRQSAADRTPVLERSPAN